LTRFGEWSVIIDRVVSKYADHCRAGEEIRDFAVAQTAHRHTANHGRISSKDLRFFLRTAAYQFTMDESAESLLQSLRNPTFELNPAELMDEIRPLFRQGIIDASMTSLAEFEREAKRDRAISMRQHADRFHPITDTAQSISYWG